MTLTKQQQESLESKGFEWVSLTIDGRELTGYVNWDSNEFYEHGSGNEFERPYQIKYNSQNETYFKL